MPRCPGCNKFCSVEIDDTSAELEVELTGVEDDKAVVHITGTIPLNSVCCGEEVGHINIDDEAEVDAKNKEYNE